MTDTYSGVKFNGTFRGSDPTEFNACVGENGSPSYYEYASGFADAALLLIDNTIEKKKNVDEQIYPICFNMRHSLELWIKHSIERLTLIRRETSLQDFDAKGSHDIGNIWKYFKRKALTVDRRFESLINEIDSHVGDIAEIDPTGQTFRYPKNTESIKHLVQVKLINVLHLKDRFTTLKDRLQELYFLTEDLIEEYRWGTYTKNLSRDDISRIAAKLPPHSEWLTELEKVKIQIKDEYNIGSKEFCDCLNIIKEHYTFANEIGLLIPLKEVTLKELFVIFDCLFRLHPIKKISNTSERVRFVKPPSAEEAQKSNSEMELAISQCIKEISPAAFIDLAALFEFGRGGKYSEQYTSVFATKMKSLPRLESRQKEYYEEVSYLLNKVNAPVSIIRALTNLNQDELVTNLTDKYDLVGG